MTALEFSSGLTAVIAVWIAYRQYQNDHLKIRHEMYDRRFTVFAALGDLLAHISANAAIDQEAVSKFSRSVKESYFLFGADIHTYLDEIFRQAIELRHQTSKIHGHNSLPVGDERTVLVKKNTELLKWFDRQLEVARNKFTPYLALY